MNAGNILHRMSYQISDCEEGGEDKGQKEGAREGEKEKKKKRGQEGEKRKRRQMWGEERRESMCISCHIGFSPIPRLPHSF